MHRLTAKLHVAGFTLPWVFLVKTLRRLGRWRHVYYHQPASVLWRISTGRFSLQSRPRVVVPPSKVGVMRTEPCWVVHATPFQYSSVGVLRRLKECQQVWATHAVYWLDDRIVTSVRQGDNNKQTQYPRGISGQMWKLCLLKKMSRLGFISRLLSGAAMRSQCLGSCRGYRHLA